MALSFCGQYDLHSVQSVFTDSNAFCSLLSLSGHPYPPPTTWTPVFPSFIQQTNDGPTDDSDAMLQNIISNPTALPRYRSDGTFYDNLCRVLPL